MRLGWLVMLAGCVTPYGQRVTVLLVDDEVSCSVPDGATQAVAFLQLDREDDLYVAELVDRVTGDRVSVPATRDGVRVTFTCPDGLDGFTVRRASVLNKEREDADAPPAPP